MFCDVYLLVCNCEKKKQFCRRHKLMIRLSTIQEERLNETSNGNGATEHQISIADTYLVQAKNYVNID